MKSASEFLKRNSHWLSVLVLGLATSGVIPAWAKPLMDSLNLLLGIAPVS